MDVIKPAKSSSSKKVQLSIVGAASLVVLLSIWFWNKPSAAEKVERSSIWTATVQRGDMAIEVEGHGKLKSAVQRLLTTPANATVDEILLKPGALVRADSIIMRLENPGIAQQVKDAKRELDNRNTKYRQLVLNQKRDLLTQQSERSLIQSQLEIAKLRVEAESKLTEKGIVSKLDFSRSLLQEKQLARQLDLAKQRSQQLQEIHVEEQTIERERIVQQQEQVEVISALYERLTVRAGIDGVLQSMPVELGQSVAMGEEIALVGSVDKLFAMLNVSQSQIDLVSPQQQVEVSTRAGTVTGYVNRINPLVEQGSVTVEVLLTGNLPANARPELNVDGVINIGERKNIIYLQKPINAASGAHTSLFRMAAGEIEAENVSIVYGQASNQFIEIVSGGRQGDEFILSDMSRWEHLPSISLN